MTVPLLSPPLTPLVALNDALRGAGHAVLSGESVAQLSGVGVADLALLAPHWDDLPHDPHLRDGGRYRRRRHGCFVVEPAQVRAVAHRAHWQPIEYNALHGGFHRWFEPLSPEVTRLPAFEALLRAFGGVASALCGARPWFVEAHAFRIDTAGGIGRPTPEGAHRDGVELVVVMLLARVGVKGGETRVFDAHGPTGQRFTLTEPLCAMLLDDNRVIHESTPIQPLDPHRVGYRDTLVLTYRRDTFQGD